MKFERNFSSGNFIKIKDGESVTGIFKGEPVEFYIHGNQADTTACEGEGCPRCKAGEEKRFRFRLNFICKQQGAIVCKIFEQGKRVYRMLKDLNEMSSLETTTLMIKRTGSSKDDTTYTIIPAMNAQLKPDEIEKLVASVQLNDLTIGTGVSNSAVKADDVSEEADVPNGAEDVPF